MTKIRMTPTEYILDLARSFPCLERKLRDWHPEKFDPDKFYEMIGMWSSGEILCALFVLTVWNPSAAKEKGWQFSLLDFAATADYANKSALVNWIENPEFP